MVCIKNEGSYSGVAGPDVFKDHNSFIFWVNHWTAQPSRQRHYNPSKHRELSAQWRGITYQKTWFMKISITDCHTILLSVLTNRVSKSCVFSHTDLNCCCPDALLLAAVIWFAICWFKSRFRCNLSCNSEIRLSMLLISSWRCDSASLCWQRRAFCCSLSLLRYCNYRQ